MSASSYCHIGQSSRFQPTLGPALDVLHLLEKLLQMVVLAKIPLQSSLKRSHFFLKVR